MLNLLAQDRQLKTRCGQLRKQMARSFALAILLLERSHLLFAWVASQWFRLPLVRLIFGKGFSALNQTICRCDALGDFRKCPAMTD